MTKRDIPVVLVFDSGVGGLSVSAKIKARLPLLEIVYAADNAAFPYGTKADQAVIERVCSVVPAIARNVQPDLVVLACNTASTVALQALREILSIPVVGVVPAIKPAAELSRSRVIGLLGTPGTVRRLYTQELIDRFAGDCTVIRHGSAELVEIAERKLRGDHITSCDVQPIVDALCGNPRGHEIDIVVLACTHFPLLGAELAACAPKHLVWIDSGEAIARRVEHLLAGQGAHGRSSPATLHHRAIFTAPENAQDQLASVLHTMGIDKIEVQTIPMGDQAQQWPGQHEV